MLERYGKVADMPGRVRTSEVLGGPSRSPTLGTVVTMNREEQSLCYQYVEDGLEV